MNKIVLLKTLRECNQASIDRLKVLVATDVGARVTTYRDRKEQHTMTADDIIRAKKTVKNLDKLINLDDEYVDFIDGRIVERERRHKELLISRGAA